MGEVSGVFLIGAEFALKLQERVADGSALAVLIAVLGIDGAELQFDAAFGRQSMEYYDGFTFAFRGPDANATPVAIGGRYDALTRALGGDVVPAVGGVIRPGILATMKDGH